MDRGAPRQQILSRRRGSRAWAHGLALLLLGLASPPLLDAQVTRDLEVADISFEGNHTYSAAQLQAAVLTERTTCRSFLFYFPLPLCPLTNWGLAQNKRYLDEGELALDLLRLRLFYRQRGFRAVRVDTLITRTERKVRIRFHIEENEPTRVTSLTLEGLEAAVDTVGLRRQLPLRVGGRLDLIQLAGTEALLTERMRDSGYVNATVLREYFIPRDGSGAEVTLFAAPGSRVRIGDILIQGSGKMGNKVVRANLEFRSGDFFGPSRVIESQTRLYGLEAFRAASIRALPRADTDTIVDLVVEVTPAPLRTVRIGGGLSTTECGQIESSFTHRNFLGGARVLKLTGKLSNIGAASLEQRFPCQDVSDLEIYQDLNFAIQADFEQPLFALGRNTFRAGLFFEKESVPDLFVRESQGGELSLTRRLARGMFLTLGYRAELTSFADQSADVFFCVNFGVCQPEDIDLLSDSRWLSPLVLRWNLERTDNPLFPTDGLRLFAEFERAGELTRSDYRYFRFLASAANFETIAPRLVLASHLRFGVVEPTRSSLFSGGADLIDEVVHPQKRFFGGGPNSVRGFGFNLLGPTVLVVNTERDCPGLDLDACVDMLPPNQLDERPVGGNALFEASLELRWRLSRKWVLVGFVDAGQVWEDVGDPEAPVATPGIGIRYRSPVGSLRFDLGYNTSGSLRKPVVAVTPDGDIIDLQREVDFDPFTFDNPSLGREVFRRLQVQLSIGEAF